MRQLPLAIPLKKAIRGMGGRESLQKKSKAKIKAKHLFKMSEAASLAAKVRGRSVDGLWPDRLFQLSEVGMRLAVPSALELALGGRAAFVHRPRPSS